MGIQEVDQIIKKSGIDTWHFNGDPTSPPCGGGGNYTPTCDLKGSTDGPRTPKK